MEIVDKYELTLSSISPETPLISKSTLETANAEGENVEEYKNRINANKTDSFTN